MNPLVTNAAEAAIKRNEAAISFGGKLGGTTGQHTLVPFYRDGCVFYLLNYVGVG
ncbi:threonyl-tRNA synthetase [Bacillus sp. SG-1]|nr:threonyl-tRNA synthetase [Bacillus sp. SG-1]